MKSNKIKKKDLFKKKIEKGEFYFYIKSSKKTNTINLLQEQTPIILENLQWKKSMKWGNYSLNWARPLKSILGIFDGKNLNFKFHHLSSCNTTFVDKEFEDKKKNFKNFGYSGHCEGIDDALFALSNGAVFIEKHFTVNQSLSGRDNKFAILPKDLKFLCDYEKNLKKIQRKLGLDLQKKEEEVYKVYRERWRG